jgi:SNF2 family DNA or RNA helicase
LVTNYDILPTLDAIKALDFAPPGIVLVFDEAHRLKGSKSQRTERSRLIAQRARDAWGRVWLLTGTPIENKPPELWNVLKVADIEREAFESWKKFVELFGGYKDKYNGMHWSEHPDPSVPVRLQRVMLRHRRVDVLPDLPPTMFQNLEVSITEKMRVELDKLVFRLSDFCDVTDPYAILEATRHEKVAFETVGNIRSLLALAKTPSMLEYIEEFEEAREPVIIMSAHLAPLKALRGRDGWNILDGSTKSSDRTDMEERFQRGELLGLACSIRAAGVALTLTRSAQVVFVDESWTPSENEQATDRVRRIGQTRGVVVTRLFADHNIDRHVLKVLGRKERLIARTLGEVKEETHG